jgi:alpha-D-ribose 1-methylphosphonate 5-triphosphate synthase subunit PhnG
MDEPARLDDDGAQLGDAAATMIVKVNKGKARAGHRILEERDHRRRWKAMLAAQMQKSADEAVAAVSIVITSARPVAIIREKLEHQIE